jgi:hypothetical protein
MTAIADTGPITAPAIQAFDVELDGGLALDCEEDVPADGEVLVAGGKTLDATGDGKELAERVIVVATVATTYKLYLLDNCGRLTGLSINYSSVYRKGFPVTTRADDLRKYWTIVYWELLKYRHRQARGA